MKLLLKFPSDTNAELFRDQCEAQFPGVSEGGGFEMGASEITIKSDELGTAQLQDMFDAAHPLGGYIVWQE